MSIELDGDGIDLRESPLLGTFLPAIPDHVADLEVSVYLTYLRVVMVIVEARCRTAASSSDSGGARAGWL